MPFRPFKQINAIITQQYFEPTISWALRVVLALNVPLIFLPWFFGSFSYDFIWAAFGGYLVSLTDYRGLHYKKILIQMIESVFIILAAFIGMMVEGSIWLSVLAMFVIGLFAAFIRNWSDYGASIGVAIGFFFLFGLAVPVSFEESIFRCLFLAAGCGWAILITLFSFPFRPANPVKRSVAKIWKANTDLLDALLDDSSSADLVREKEMSVRTAVNQSVDLFDRNAGKTAKVKHYDLIMDLRRLSALFSGSLSSMHEELEVIRSEIKDLHDAALQKTLSSFAQCSARIAILTYTSHAEDLSIATARLARCAVSVEVLKEAIRNIKTGHRHERSLSHFLHALERAYSYMDQSLKVLEQKLNLGKKEYFEGYKLTYNNFIAGVQSRFVVDFFRNLFNINSEQFRYALRVALVLCLGVFIFKFFRIDHGYWIPLTMIIVIQPYYGATRKKGIERIVGTSAGIIVGGLLMLLPLSHNVFVGMLVLVSFFVAYFLRNNYKVGVFFVTVMMVVLMQISQQASLELIGWRILSTLIGALLAFFSGFILWPVWEKERFPQLMQRSVAQLKEYLSAILKFVNNDLREDNWYRFRRSSEEAINHVFASVERMLEEPDRKQAQADISFSLVGSLLRINREITSVALLAERAKDRIRIDVLTDYYKSASEFLDKLSLFFEEEKKIEVTNDFADLKTALSSPEFAVDETSQLIKNELEKIVFEMEALSKLSEARNK